MEGWKLRILHISDPHERGSREKSTWRRRLLLVMRGSALRIRREEELPSKSASATYASAPSPSTGVVPS
ncbi:MAG TPA: hypothetical protein VK420_14180, partial [Longimicrobium sp.]|nr:hypothetical protein [Longimicrobium sp.]